MDQAIYSMSVLPNSATFVSFFIVLAIFFVFTTTLVISFETIVTKMRHPAKLLHGPLTTAAASLKIYIDGYKEMLNHHNDYRVPSLYSFSGLPWWLLRSPTIMLLRSFLLPEINMPMDQYMMFQYRHNPVANIRFL